MRAARISGSAAGCRQAMLMHRHSGTAPPRRVQCTGGWVSWNSGALNSMMARTRRRSSPIQRGQRRSSAARTGSLQHVAARRAQHRAWPSVSRPRPPPCGPAPAELDHRVDHPRARRHWSRGRAHEAAVDLPAPRPGSRRSIGSCRSRCRNRRRQLHARGRAARRWPATPSASSIAADSVISQVSSVGVDLVALQRRGDTVEQVGLAQAGAPRG